MSNDQRSEDDREYDVAVGKALTELRTDKGQHRAFVHRVSGVTPAEQREYEHGVKTITLQHLRWLASAYDVTAGRLLNLAEEKL